MNQLLPVVRAMTYQVEGVPILDVKTTERHGHGVIRKIKSAFSVKGLQTSAIKNILLWQAEIYTTEELLEGKTLGGLFVDPETLLFKTIRLHPDKIGLDRIDRPHPLLISMFIGGADKMLDYLEVVHVLVRRPRSSGSALFEVGKAHQGDHQAVGLPDKEFPEGLAS